MNGLDMLGGFDWNEAKKDWGVAHGAVMPVAAKVPFISSFVPLADVVYSAATGAPMDTASQKQAAATSDAYDAAKLGKKPTTSPGMPGQPPAGTNPNVPGAGTPAGSLPIPGTPPPSPVLHSSSSDVMSTWRAASSGKKAAIVALSFTGATLLFAVLRRFFFGGL